MNTRDQYLSALGITQWVCKTAAHIEPVIFEEPELWRKLGVGQSSQDFAFVVEGVDQGAELLNKIISAIGQAPEHTLIYTSSCSVPDGLPVVAANHVIVLGYAALHAQAPASYHCAPSLAVLSRDVDAKRALWVAMKTMMSAHV